MRLKTSFKKEKGFQYNYSTIEYDPAPPQHIEILYFDDAYSSSFISQSEYFVQRRDHPLLQSISYIVEGKNCWKIIDGGETIRIILFGKRSYDKAVKLLKMLLDKYSLTLDSVTIGFEDHLFIKEIIKAIYH